MIRWQFGKARHWCTCNTNPLAKGDFVLTLSNIQTLPFVPVFTNLIRFDLIRLDQSGKDAGHWDMLQELNGADRSRGF